MLPLQYALGPSGGTEILTQIFMQAMDTLLFQTDSHNPHAGLKFNFKNMFNLASRKAVLAKLEQDFPELCYIFMKLYPAIGNTVWIQLPDGTWTQKDGFAQGCPFSLFFSCLALLELMSNLKTEL